MKSFYKILILILIGVLFQSCSIYKTSKLTKQGGVTNKDYFTQIPFKYYNDLIFIEVVINDKKYNFFIDTGAELNVIGQHIEDEIHYKVITSSKVSSTSKTKQNVEFIDLPKISISNIDFENTGAIIADLSHFDKFFGCEKIDGIIGNNLLRKSIWQIDYKNRTIIITDNFEKLTMSQNASEIVMNSGKSRNVYFDVTVDGVKSKFIFDTGFTGKIKSDKRFLELLIANNKELEYTTETGNVGADLHGVTDGTTYNAFVKTINIEGVIINNQIISLEQGSQSLIGNQFFKNYVLTLDWKNAKLFLDLINEIKADTLKGYELIFSPNYLTNKIEIIRYRDDYQLSEKVNIGTEILMINDIDVSNFSTIELCEFWNREEEKIKNQKSLGMVILDKGVRKKIKLTEKIILSK